MTTRTFGASIVALGLAAWLSSALAQQPRTTSSDARPAQATEAPSAYTVGYGQGIRVTSPAQGLSGTTTAYGFGQNADTANSLFRRAETGPDQETLKLVKQLETVNSDGERREIKDKLRDVLAKQFDQRQKRHGQEIENLEAQVKKLKDLVSKRQENRDEIISRRLEQIQRDAEGLGW